MLKGFSVNVDLKHWVLQDKAQHALDTAYKEPPGVITALFGKTHSKTQL